MELDLITGMADIKKHLRNLTTGRKQKIFELKVYERLVNLKYVHWNPANSTKLVTSLY